MNEKKIKVMFDSNAFDKVLSNLDVMQIMSDKVDYYVTTIQIEELSEIPDSKKENRTRNLIALCELRANLVPIIALLDKARINYYRLGGGDVFSLLLNENGSNVNDALIGQSAKDEDCLLITNDVRFAKKLQNAGINTMNFEEFIDNYSK